MRQRVMIALALTGSPRLLLADEPTTALDVVVQRELLQEMRALVQARGMSMLIVTHDLNLARDVADDVSVMYAGHVLEEGPVSDVITRPAHPYTEGDVYKRQIAESRSIAVLSLVGGDESGRDRLQVQTGREKAGCPSDKASSRQ